MLRVLIANRGEIAVRVIRAAAEAGYSSIAVYADQDADAMHVRLADEAYALGGARPAETYLNAAQIVEVAKAAKADAVHPGYGFLSESADFARAVEAAGLVWIGPTPETIEQLGDKITARGIALRVGAPLVAGTAAPLESPQEAVEFAAEHGLPIAIKAAFGGGGRGLKVVRDLSEVAEAFVSASREAEIAFGRGECFIERFLDSPRHLEAQILGDGTGNVVVVGDRDCSLQRRNQKLVEEAPAPGLTAAQRESIHSAARNICGAVNYRGAGTVEFLMGSDGVISFLEVNTRLQVEHPVTEEVAGVDLVREQFRIAFGEPMTVTSTPEPVGHAIELRINAEDPGRGFLPSPGTVSALRVPAGPGVRWDSGVQAGDRVEPAFDSMMAKLVVHADSREEAIVRARRAVRELQIDGVATVAPFSAAVLTHDDFATDTFAVHTQWIERELMPTIAVQPRAAGAPAADLRRFPMEIDGRRVMVGLPAALVAGFATGAATGAVAAAPAAEADPATLEADTPGQLARWLVEDGAWVVAGQDVAVIDAMKMEAPVAAHRAGVIVFSVAAGAAVAVGESLAVIR